MKGPGACVLILGGVLVAWAAAQPAAITIDYPETESIFPPELPPPNFIWRDAGGNAVEWRIEISFAEGAAPIRVNTPGEPLRIGEIDPRCISDTNEVPKLTLEQAASKSWRPDEATWAAIKLHSMKRPATVTITGLRDNRAVSSGRLTIQTSKDPVGAPVFYRDVPLMPSEMKKGVIKPLAPSALPLIAWRLRNIGETSSRVLLTGMHTCANCHSFSADGKTLGMDLDGPQNDKGLYALAAIRPETSIRNEDMISWDPTRIMQPTQARVGFMSQVSPDGQYVLTTVHITQNATTNYYLANFKDYRFLQVFYPTQGILACYSRATGRREPLPGADDPRYVQTDGVWSPDGKYVVFARAEAKDPEPPHGKPALYANDPNETPIQYDLYRVPFNGGRGGRAEPIAGASRNGLSNAFPKVSPDGRWIVYVQCRNGQLMRPGSQLFIVPAKGGRARRLRANLPAMNSWHSFSPNGRWLVFSSKGRSPYTQMFLTHLDEKGNDSPAILIENATAANRAVNIPEFVNIPPDGLLKIEVPAVDFYNQFDRAFGLSEKGDYQAAIPEWEKALTLNPKDAKSQYNLGAALAESGRPEEAKAHYLKALELDPEDPTPYDHLGVLLARDGKQDEAIPYFEKVLKANPKDQVALLNLCGALAVTGQRIEEAIQHCQKVLEVSPDMPQIQVNIAIALSKAGRLDEAITHLEKAAQLVPGDAAIESNLGAALAQRGRIEEAIPHFEKALEVAPEFAEGHYNMGVLYYLRGRIPEALAQWRILLKLEPNHAAGLIRTARILATSSDAALRKGAEAVELAERATSLSGGQEPEFLDTLAAAYAEAGRFADAVSAARRAQELSRQQNNSQLASALSGRIALYEAKTPLREEPGR